MEIDGRIETDPKKIAKRIHELKNLTVARIKIQSTVKGVVKGRVTKLLVRVHEKWVDVFKLATPKIKMNPKVHELVGRNEILDINSRVREYCKRVRSSEPDEAYNVWIIEKQTPESKPRSNRKQAPETNQTPSAIIPNPTNGPKKQAQEPQAHCSHSPPADVLMPPPPVPRRRGRPSKAKQPSVPEDPVPVPSGQQKKNGVDVIHLHFAKQLAELNQPQSQVHLPVRPQPPSRAFINEIRDESTNAGEYVVEGEEDVKGGIVKYIQEHVSNRDMLEIRRELLALKRQKKFQSLNRLISFTSGFLQNAFVDALDS